MYNLCLDYYKENNTDEKCFADKCAYHEVFNTRFNLSFKALKIDTCNACDST